MIPQKTIERLSLYRRILAELQREGTAFVYSHRLAELAGGTAAQVRRDLMLTGYSGSPTRGYNVIGLLDTVTKMLDGDTVQKIALVGAGNLGRALMAYFSGRHPKLSLVAAFDKDSHKTGRVVHGCRCFPMDELSDVVAENHIRIAFITVPADEADVVVQTLVQAGVRGIVNFAPVRLSVPRHVHVENVDLTVVLEKVAYFSRSENGAEGR